MSWRGSMLNDWIATIGDGTAARLARSRIRAGDEVRAPAASLRWSSRGGDLQTEERAVGAEAGRAVSPTHRSKTGACSRPAGCALCRTAAVAAPLAEASALEGDARALAPLDEHLGAASCRQAWVAQKSRDGENAFHCSTS